MQNKDIPQRIWVDIIPHPIEGKKGKLVVLDKNDATMGAVAYTRTSLKAEENNPSKFTVSEFQALCKEHWIWSNSRTIARMIHKNFPNGIAIIDNGEKE